MTLEQLRESTTATLLLVGQLSTEVGRLEQFILRVDSLVSDAVFGSTIDVDAFVVAQTPIYAALLVVIEAAADALGTDN